MTTPRIIIAGGTGQIGKALLPELAKLNYEVIIITRSKSVYGTSVKLVNWKDPQLPEFINGSKAIINLCGKNVNCRYTNKNKRDILNSRIHSVQNLSDLLKKVSLLPEVWIQASSSTIYRESIETPMTEESTEFGNGFSEEICKKWEHSFTQCSQQFPALRTVVLRISLVLSKKEGVYPRLKNLTKIGFGGKQGNGKQMVSWIHETDIVNFILLCIHSNTLNGLYNCSSPKPLDNTTFMTELRKSLRAKFGLPTPKWLLEAGALLIGTETELILKSRYVLPERMLATGFQFTFPDLFSAFTQLKNVAS